MAYNLYTGQQYGNDTDALYGTMNQPYDSGDFSSGSESQGSGSSSASSQSWSGLPSWINDPNYNKNIRNFYNDWGRTYGDAYNNTFRPITVNPAMTALIEQQRKLMPEQYRNQMDLYYQRSLNPMMNKLSSRGVLNSSITGDALAKSLRDVSARYGDEATKANVWASNELMKQTGTEQAKRMTQWQSLLNFLPQFLAALRESTSSSNQSSEWSNESSSWGPPMFPGME